MSAQVSSQPGQPTHHISFSDGVETWGAILEDGARGITEQPVQASSLVQVTRASRYGSGEPGQIEQRNWTGGRGQENFFDDDSRFYDGQNLWTLSDELLLNGPQWNMPTAGYAPGERSLPGNVEWRSLLGSEKYLAIKFTPASSLTCLAGYHWIRRRGRPGTLTAELRSDSGGSPNTVLKSATATVSNVTDVVSEFYGFDWASGQALSGGTAYWLVLYGASTDNQANHWEVGTQRNGSNGKSSSDGSSWSASSYPPYFFASATVGPETTELFWHFFELEGAWYAVSKVAANVGVGATSVLYLQGDRGNCDSNSGALTKLNDATKSWTTNQWVGAKVKIIAGPGLGEWRTITANDGTQLTVSPAFETTQTTAGRYVIYDTPIWYALPRTGDDALPSGFTVTDVCVCNGIAFMACGSNAIKQFRVNSSDELHDFNTTETATGRLLKLFYHPDDGRQIWRTSYTASEISRAAPVTWGNTFTFATAITVGEDGHLPTNLLAYDDELWVIKPGSLWRVKNDRPARLDVGLEAMNQPTNGVAATTQNLFLFFNYAQSVERLYGQTLDDMGPWKGAGLPSNRAGPIAALLPVLGWLFAAVDGGLTGTSSILAWNGVGWTEIFRSWEVGRRIRSLAWLTVPGGQPKLYFSHGSLFNYLTFPQDALHPLRDTAMPYAHEGVFVSSTFDLGTVRLPKFYKEFEAVVDGFRRSAGTTSSKGKEIWLDTQYDDDVGTSNWVTRGVLESAPVDQVQLGDGGRRSMRYRLRINTNEATTPVVVRGTTLEAYARTPVKYQYHLRLRTSSLQRTLLGQQDADPDDFITWLKLMARSASKVTVRSMFKQWDDKLVIIEPPTILRKWQNTILAWMGASITVTVRDA